MIWTGTRTNLLHEKNLHVYITCRYTSLTSWFGLKRLCSNKTAHTVLAVISHSLLKFSEGWRINCYIHLPTVLILSMLNNGGFQKIKGNRIAFLVEILKGCSNNNYRLIKEAIVPIAHSKCELGRCGADTLRCVSIGDRISIPSWLVLAAQCLKWNSISEYVLCVV